MGEFLQQQQLQQQERDTGSGVRSNGIAGGGSSRSSSSGSNGSNGKKQQQQRQRQPRLTITSLYKQDLLELVMEHLYEDLVPFGRESCQSELRRLTTVSRAWVGPASRRLYKNPFLGCKERALQLQLCLEAYPERGKLVKKLIFGEGSSTDITDWPAKTTVPSIIRHSPNVQIVGFDGLVNIDLHEMKSALLGASELRELRCCDLMPAPWPSVHFFFNQIVVPCRKLVRLRLYGLHSDEPDQESSDNLRNHISSLDRAFEEVQLSQCAINAVDLKAIFAGSSASAASLHLEYPQDLPDNDLLEVLGVIDGSLKFLSVEGYRMQDTSDDGDYPDYLTERILDRCPNLESLLFSEGLASPRVIPRLVRSKLRVWSFSCTPELRPHHWVEAFKQRQWPTAKCYVRTADWSHAELRKVRIAAWRAGVSWLESDAEL